MSLWGETAERRPGRGRRESCRLRCPLRPREPRTAMGHRCGPKSRADRPREPLVRPSGPLADCFFLCSALLFCSTVPSQSLALTACSASLQAASAGPSRRSQLCPCSSWPSALAAQPSLSLLLLQHGSPCRSRPSCCSTLGSLPPRQPRLQAGGLGHHVHLHLHRKAPAAQAAAPSLPAAPKSR